MAKRKVSEEWVTECSKHLVAENFKFINTQAESHGDVAADSLLINFMACFIGATLYNTLTSLPEELKGDKNAAHDYLVDAFADMKMRVQDAVAAGFSGALAKFSGKDCEYYCRVTPVGPIVNKLPC